MTPKYIDIHSHVNFKAFDEDREEVIKRALESDTWTINVGTQIDTSNKAVEMANQYKEGVYAIVGLHPIHTGASYHDEKELGVGGKEFTSRGEIFDYDFYKKLALDPKTVAIGECGLDYFRISNEESRIKQETDFKKQIELAIEVDKPLMLHLRNGPQRSAYDDAFSILNSQFKIHNSRLRGNLHFFAGSIPEAKKFLDLGSTFSFTGVITFTKDYDEVVKYIPLERIMSETDSPYVTPAHFQGKRNEPLYVKEVVKRIAKIKGMDVEIVRKQILENASKFFNISI